MAEGNPHPDRDRQPSARYVARLADALAPEMLKVLDPTTSGIWTLEPSLRRSLVWWTIVEVAKQQRAQNEERD